MVLDIGMEESTITIVDRQVVISGEILILARAIATDMVEIVIKLNGTMIIVVIIIDKMVTERDKLLQDHSQRD